MSVVARHVAQSGSLAEQAYRLFEEQLVTLRLAPGELIGEKDLVNIAGIGRTPVREAIQRLSAEGLLQVLPRKGLMVTPLRRSDLSQIIEARRRGGQRRLGEQRVRRTRRGYAFKHSPRRFTPWSTRGIRKHPKLRCEHPRGTWRSV